MIVFGYVKNQNKSVKENILLKLWVTMFMHPLTLQHQETYLVVIAADYI